MPAYLIANITVISPAAYAEYAAKVPAVLAQYGGRYLARGGAVETLEGKFDFDRLVWIEFPSMEAAKQFYHSPEYAPLLTLRSTATRSSVAFVEGYAPA